MGDTGLELAPGHLRSDTACLLLSGALRSAQIRSLKYHGEAVSDGTYFSRSTNSAGRWHSIRELPQVRITQDDAMRAHHPSERHKVVIPGVRRQARIGRRILNQQPVLHQARHEPVDLGPVNRRRELRAAQNPLQLGEQQRANDHIEVPVGPSVENLRRRAVRREQRRDEDIAVQDDA
jgi:hypothetical protein